MRNLLIVSFFVCIYLHFQSRKPEVVQSDSLSTKQSSIKKIAPSKSTLPVVTHVETLAGSSAISGFVESEDDQIVSSADVEEEYDDDDLSQLPWDDIEEGWKTHLKEFLVNADPEKAEEMFAAYLEEKKKYVERVDFTDGESPQSDLVVEEDGKEGELERVHSENLREIFGDNYSKIQSLHQEYVDSVQYLNRSSVKFSISL
jgi:hypothetical protein